MNTTDTFLQRCIQLAWLGGTRVGVNPRVGAIVVHEGRIIGEGYHTHQGAPHAEVAAIQSVREPALLPHSTLYVSLEPCCFQGKTPPCTDLILRCRIPRVVIGCLDPNPKVSGKGMAKLQAHGVEVSLAPDSQPFVDLNRPFFRNQMSGRPYLTLKWAESEDGFIAGVDAQQQPLQTKISGMEAALLSHRLRATHQAILVGASTVRIDDPRLTTRLLPESSPQPIIMGQADRIPSTAKLLQQEPRALLSHPAPGESLDAWVMRLYQEQDISSILVEGGARVLQQFLDAGLYDEVYRYQAPLQLGQGVPAPVLELHWTEIQALGRDRLYHYQRPL